MVFGRRLPAALGSLSGPFLIILVLTMMIVPLPPLALDMLFTFNISLSLVVMLASLYTSRVLDFSAFPSVLLVTTLMRLALNVASTRVILMHGQNGPGAAGHVIESFGQFVVGGSYTVGLVVFAIFIIINFVVVTKGSTRIAEVAARFTLDAMPGKQMAIDADLNAGMIGEEEARKRRQEVSREADFFGAMDGASKFVRGDAVAAILILLINIVGGLVIGVTQYHMGLAQAAGRYALLTVGDGLVAQIPALVISTAAGVVVSRVSREDVDLGRQIFGQLFARTAVIGIVASVLAGLGLIPGMPHTAFLGMGAALGFFAWRRSRKAARDAEVEEPAESKQQAQDESARDVTWADIEPVDPLSLEVGYRLIEMVDNKQKGALIPRIRSTRKKYARDLGFLIPPVHLRDNLELQPNGYRILLRDVEVAAGEVFPDLLLAIDPGNVSKPLQGAQTRDPAFGLPAVWIDREQRDKAQADGYTVVDPATVIATHLSQVFEQYAGELLGQPEVEALLERVREKTPKLGEELGKNLPVITLVAVLRRLLDEGVSIRDVRTIAETLLENTSLTQDPILLAEAVRRRLGPLIVQQLYGSSEELQMAALSPRLEELLSEHLRTAEGGGQTALEPGLAHRLLEEARRVMHELESRGLAAVIITRHNLRPLLARFLSGAARRLRVLSYEEIPDHKSIRVVATLGTE